VHASPKIRITRYQYALTTVGTLLCLGHSGHTNMFGHSLYTNMFWPQCASHNVLATVCTPIRFGHLCRPIQFGHSKHTIKYWPQYVHHYGLATVAYQNILASLQTNMYRPQWAHTYVLATVCTPLRIGQSGHTTVCWPAHTNTVWWQWAEHH